ncbi:MAG TPA: PadR family transcriptional regulator [Sphingomicrobium sp.]|jgi:DNA-binding PadR family transcriptional regulator|nr:PadR family transcriptional regulator [Sphingomicrobium sp.]
MNARLLVLGVLHRGDLHPYEIKRRLEAAMIECYTDVDVGTLYYAVRQLEKEGLIEAVAQERVTRGGIRTIYTITAKGRSEFRKGLRRQLDAEGPVSQTLYGAMLFLHLADPGVVKKSLRRRLALLDELISKLEPIREELAPRLSTGGRHLLGHIERQRQLDRDWVKSILADIERNGIRDVTDPERLATT